MNVEHVPHAVHTRTRSGMSTSIILLYDSSSPAPPGCRRCSSRVRTRSAPAKAGASGTAGPCAQPLALSGRCRPLAHARASARSDARAKWCEPAARKGRSCVYAAWVILSLRPGFQVARAPAVRNSTSCCLPGPGIGAGPGFRIPTNRERAPPCAARAPIKSAASPAAESGSTSSKFKLITLFLVEGHGVRPTGSPDCSASARQKLVNATAGLYSCLSSCRIYQTSSITSARKEPSRALSRTKRTREPSGGRSAPLASTSEKTYAWFSRFSAAGDALKDSFS